MSRNPCISDRALGSVGSLHMCKKLMQVVTGPNVHDARPMGIRLLIDRTCIANLDLVAGPHCRLMTDKFIRYVIMLWNLMMYAPRRSEVETSKHTPSVCPARATALRKPFTTRKSIFDEGNARKLLRS